MNNDPSVDPPPPTPAALPITTGVIIHRIITGLLGVAVTWLGTSVVTQAPPVTPKTDTPPAVVTPTTDIQTAILQFIQTAGEDALRRALGLPAATGTSKPLPIKAYNGSSVYDAQQRNVSATGQELVASLAGQNEDQILDAFVAILNAKLGPNADRQMDALVAKLNAKFDAARAARMKLGADAVRHDAEARNGQAGVAPAIGSDAANVKTLKLAAKTPYLAATAKPAANKIVGKFAAGSEVQIEDTWPGPPAYLFVEQDGIRGWIEKP